MMKQAEQSSTVFLRCRTAVLFAALLALPWLSKAAEFNRAALLTTAGSVVDVDGEDYAYLLWQPGDALATLGNSYGIYVKEGTPDAPGAFTLLGRTTLQTSHQTTLSLLRLGHLVDAHGAMLAPRVDALFREAIVQPGAEPVLRPGGPAVGPGEPDLDTAEKLQYLIRASINTPDSLRQLFFFGRTHPGVMMTLGHGYAVPMPHDVSTFEIRLLSSSGSPLRVVGRITLDVNDIPQLPPPGPPVQVFHSTRLGHAMTSAKDHLVARMRWSMDDTLRRELPAANGYDIFRVPEANAVALDFTGPIGPPTAGMLAAVEAGHAVHVNQLPIFASPLLSPAEAADPLDNETFHYADDNDLAGGGDPFQDGDSFYYFIAARDISGRPGAISPGTLFVVSHRLPPLPPDRVEVRNHYIAPDFDAGESVEDALQHLEVVITQHPDFPEINGAPDPRQISEYHVYRWASPRAYLTEGGNPATNHVGTVAHVPGEKFAVFLDDGPLAPKSPDDYGRTWYYTVRAVDSASVTANWSAHSGPAFGVIRDRRSHAGPDATEIIAMQTTVNASFPDREFDLFFDELGLTQPPPPGFGFFVQIERQDPGVTDWRVQIVEQATNAVRDTRQGSFPAGQNMVRVYFEEPLADNLVAFVAGRALPGDFGSTASGLVPQQPIIDPNKVWVLPFLLETELIPVPTDPAAPWNFHLVTEPDGIIVPVTGTLNLPPDTYSWRIYRRVRPGGEPDLVASGYGEPLPPSVDWKDENPPMQPGLTVCYYVQTFDPHGNASAMERIGECLTTQKLSADIPTPIIISAESLGADPDGNRRVMLSWFSELVNVDRFEIAVSNATANHPGARSEFMGPISDFGLFFMLDENRISFFRRYQTVRASALSTTGRFDLEITLNPEETYFFVVRAVGVGQPDVDDDTPPGQYTRAASEWTDVVQVVWSEPDPGPAGPVIPWPARPLPPILNTQVAVDQFAPGTGPFHATRLIWPVGEGGGDGGGDGDRRPGDGDGETSADLLPGVGIFLGLIPGGNLDITYDTEQLGDNARLTPIATFNNVGNLNLTNHLFRPMGNTGAWFPTTTPGIFPFVVYRHQLPSARFPQAVPNLLQVSPQIDRINTTPAGANSFVLRDPYIVPVSLNMVPVPVSGTFDVDDPQEVNAGLNLVSMVPSGQLPAYLGNSTSGLYWVDHMPVIEGATYRYLIVQFSANGEIRRVIPTNPVEF
jgi:hypothetical protein